MAWLTRRGASAPGEFLLKLDELIAAVDATGDRLAALEAAVKAVGCQDIEQHVRQAGELLRHAAWTGTKALLLAGGRKTWDWALGAGLALAAKWMLGGGLPW